MQQQKIITGGLAKAFMKGDRTEAVAAAVLRAAKPQHLEHVEAGLGVRNNSRQQGLVAREP